jgi:hypothetical protein
MNKKINSISGILLLFVLTVSFPNSSYADNNSAKIIGIKSTSRMSDKTTIIDLQNNNFRALFKIDKESNYQISPEVFLITDSENVEHKGTIILDSSHCDSIGKKRPSGYVCNVTGSFDNITSNIYKEFTIMVASDAYRKIETIRDKMPELKFSLKSAKLNGIYDALEVANISSKKIRVVSISGDILKAEIMHEYEIPVGGNVEIELELKPCRAGVGNFDETIVIEYKVDDECLISGDVVLSCSCNIECNSAIDSAIKNVLTDTLINTVKHLQYEAAIDQEIAVKEAQDKAALAQANALKEAKNKCATDLENAVKKARKDDDVLREYAVERCQNEASIAWEKAVNEIRVEAEKTQKAAMEDILREKMLTIEIVDNISGEILKKLSVSHDDIMESVAVLVEMKWIAEYKQTRKPLEQAILDNELSRDDKDKLDNILEHLGVKRNDKGYIMNSYNHATLKVVVT